jgi:hypothetical protein
MTKKRIHIGNLQIRLSVRVDTDARALAAGIGREVLRNIAGAVGERRGRLRIDELSPVKISAAGRKVSEIQRQAALGIAAEIRRKMGQEE